jgi:hypothetical protein
MSQKEMLYTLLLNIWLAAVSFILGILCERSRTNRVSNVSDEASEIVSYIEETNNY